MNDKFIVIGITRPYNFPEEIKKITSLISSGKVNFLHIRKPTFSIEETAEFINKIPKEMHPYLKIHDHFGLLNDYDLGGVHLNNRNPHWHSEVKSKSKSIHSLEELDRFEDFDYMTLSPVFDSISKKGYESAFDLKKISSRIRGKRIVALGGVTPEKFELLKNSGFYGGAMLGYLWENEQSQISNLF